MVLKKLVTGSKFSLSEAIESSPFINGFYTSTLFHGFYVSPEGLDVIKGSNGGDENFFHKLLIGSFKRMNALWDYFDAVASRELFDGPDLKVSSLKPHIDLDQILVSAEGSQGSVWRFPKISDFVFKFYHNNLESDVCGFDQFKSLLDVPSNTVFKTPTPYFATDHLCAMSSFPSDKDYWNFVFDNPGEEKLLHNHIYDLNETDPLICDVDDILFYYLGSDLTIYDSFRGKGSVFVLDFDPSKEDPYERYTLGTVDVSSKDY